MTVDEDEDLLDDLDEIEVPLDVIGNHRIQSGTQIQSQYQYQHRMPPQNAMYQPPPQMVYHQQYQHPVPLQMQQQQYRPQTIPQPMNHNTNPQKSMNQKTQSGYPVIGPRP